MKYLMRWLFGLIRFAWLRTDSSKWPGTVFSKVYFWSVLNFPHDAVEFSPWWS